MKSQSIQEIWAPLSTRAWVVTAFIMCEGEMTCTGIRIVGTLDDTSTWAHESSEGRDDYVRGASLSKNPQ